MLIETLEKNQRNLHIIMPKKNKKVSVGELISELDFFKHGFSPNKLSLIVNETQEQHYKIDESIFEVFLI